MVYSVHGFGCWVESCLFTLRCIPSMGLCFLVEGSLFTLKGNKREADEGKPTDLPVAWARGSLASAEAPLAAHRA